MLNEEIEKLKTKVEKDPSSKLFVPLAEEYRKLGILDEAIKTLLRGLEHQPNYMTARVALGKIYLDKKMLSEAKEEFKKVVSAIPDNLFALKKIAEISMELGEIQEAIEALKGILRVNPGDEEAKNSLESLESQQKEMEILNAPSVPPEPSIASSIQEEETEPPLHELESFMTIQDTSFKEEEFESFKSEIFNKGLPLHADEEIQPIKEEYKIEKDLMEETLKEEPFQKGDIEREIPLQEQEEEIEAEIISDEDFYVDQIEVVEETSMTPVEVEDDDIISADLLVKEGKYQRAMEIYKEILKREPENKKVLQRLEELKAFLKIMGKGDELLMEELNRFLEAIRKRKDEFFRNP